MRQKGSLQDTVGALDDVVERTLKAHATGMNPIANDPRAIQPHLHCPGGG